MGSEGPGLPTREVLPAAAENVVGDGFVGRSNPVAAGGMASGILPAPRSLWFLQRALLDLTYLQGP